MINPNQMFPIKGFKNTVFLKALINDSDITNVHAGEYSYYSDFNDPTKFLENNVLYNFGISNTSLRIGKFCAIAHGVKFIMADANHAMSGITTFPFPVFGGEWSESMPMNEYPTKQYEDIEIGNDVWIGYEATIMPGVKIGNGAIIGSKSLVASDVPPYSIVGGNPAKVIRYRFDQEKIDLLQDLAWWDWPIDQINKRIPDLINGNFEEILK